MTHRQSLIERLRKISADMHYAVAGGMAWISYDEASEFIRRINEIADELDRAKASQ